MTHRTCPGCRLAAAGGPLGVDFFLITTAMLAAYQLVPQLESGGTGPLHMRRSPAATLLRYWRGRAARLIPAYAATNLLALVALGPRDGLAPEQAIARNFCFADCPASLWRNVLFITNWDFTQACGESASWPPCREGSVLALGRAGWQGLQLYGIACRCMYAGHLGRGLAIDLHVVVGCKQLSICLLPVAGSRGGVHPTLTQSRPSLCFFLPSLQACICGACPCRFSSTSSFRCCCGCYALAPQATAPALQPRWQLSLRQAAPGACGWLSQPPRCTCRMAMPSGSQLSRRPWARLCRRLTSPAAREWLSWRSGRRWACCCALLQPLAGCCAGGTAKRSQLPYTYHAQRTPPALEDA